MNSTYAQIAPLLAQAGAMQPDPQYDVWDLAAPGCLGRLIARRPILLSREMKHSILSIVLRGPLPVFFFQEEELDTEHAAAWSEVADGVWQLPADADPKALVASEALYCGNWRIIVAERIPSAPMTDFIRAPASDVASFLKRSEAAVLIDSFHDDAVWRIALAQEVSSK